MDQKLLALNVLYRLKNYRKIQMVKKLGNFFVFFSFSTANYVI